MGESADVSEGTRGEETGASCGTTKEKDGEGESVRQQRKMHDGRERHLALLRGDNSEVLREAES